MQNGENKFEEKRLTCAVNSAQILLCFELQTFTRSRTSGQSFKITTLVSMTQYKTITFTTHTPKLWQITSQITNSPILTLFEGFSLFCLLSILPPAQCSGKILQKQQKLNFVKLVFNILLNYLIYFRQFLQLGVIMSDGHVNYSNNTQQTNAWKVHILTTITWKGIFVGDIFPPVIIE